MDCPLSELDLLVHSRQTGFYHLNRSPKPIPYEIFGYALQSGQESDYIGNLNMPIDQSLTELTHGPNAPGRVFCLTSEALYELISGYASHGLVRLDGNAGERILRIDPRTGIEWMDAYYDSVDLVEAA